MRRPPLHLALLLATACGAAPLDVGPGPRDGAAPADAPDATTGPAPADAGALDADAPPPTDAGSDPSDAGTTTSGDASEPPDTGSTPVDAGHAPTDAGPTPAARQPILFVHGINGSSADFAVMVDRLVQEGWPRTWLRALDFPSPRWGCNVDNAAIVQAEVERLRADTGAARVDLVAHSMGVLSTRYYLKNLGGTAAVSTYVTLGGMHHGQRSACLNPLPVCVWQEICPTHAYLTDLNAPPATPGPVHWVSIYSMADETIDPASSELVGAENVVFMGVPHAGAGGLTEDPGIYAELRRVLDYPSP